jgi:hypothetical protein
MYSCTTNVRWRGPVIKRWLRHSRCRVPIQRSAYVFALGARAGVRMVRISVSANTVSKAEVDVRSR